MNRMEGLDDGIESFIGVYEFKVFEHSLYVVSRSTDLELYKIFFENINNGISYDDAKYTLKKDYIKSTYIDLTDDKIEKMMSNNFTINITKAIDDDKFIQQLHSIIRENKINKLL